MEESTKIAILNEGGGEGGEGEGVRKDLEFHLFGDLD